MGFWDGKKAWHKHKYLNKAWNKVMEGEATQIWMRRNEALKHK